MGVWLKPTFHATLLPVCNETSVTLEVSALIRGSLPRPWGEGGRRPGEGFRPILETRTTSTSRFGFCRSKGYRLRLRSNCGAHWKRAEGPHSRRHSMSRRPEPYSRPAISHFAPSIWRSTASSLVKTTSNFEGLLARCTSSKPNS